MDAPPLPRPEHPSIPAPATAASADPHGDSTLAVATEAEITATRGFVEASRAASTRRAYAADWARFEAWCRDRATPALPAPAPLVAIYLSNLAANGLAPPSVARALAAIAHRHNQARLIPPHRAEGGSVVTDVLAGIRRSRVGGPNRKAPADADVVAQLLRSIEGDNPAALRDRALIAFGMALAARRSELVALDISDLAWEDKGLRVTVRRSKTDQDGEGAVVAVPDGRRLRPLAHLRAWLETAAITEGPVFRPLWKGGRIRPARLSDHAVARIVQARALGAGLDPARFAGHSLRAGFVTEAARQGADVWKIQQVSRHKSMQVLATYVRDAHLFDDHAGDAFL